MAETQELIPTSTLECEQPRRNVFITRELAATIQDAVLDAREVTTIPLDDPAAYAVACDRYTALKAVQDAVEAKRVEIKDPALVFTTALDAAAKAVRATTNGELQRLGTLIYDYKVADEARVRREREKAEAERAAAQKKLDDEAAAERQRLHDEAEALRLAVVKAQDEDRAAAIAAGEDPMPVAAPPPVPEPEVFVAPAKMAPAVYIPKAVSAPVGRKVTFELVIEDLSKVPDEIAGSSLWILDEAKAMKLLAADVPIPGLSRKTVTGIKSTGR